MPVHIKSRSNFSVEITRVFFVNNRYYRTKCQKNIFKGYALSKKELFQLISDVVFAFQPSLQAMLPLLLLITGLCFCFVFPSFDSFNLLSPLNNLKTALFTLQ